MEMAGKELLDPAPDIHDLFCHYNTLYFDDALGSCIVSWSTSRMTSCTSTCHYDPGGGCEIRLSEPLLKFCSAVDLKNTLLHEMIHAFLWIKYKNKDHSDHGSSFQDKMNDIYSSSLIDHQKPYGGYDISLCHEFKKEVNTYKFYQWICDTCGDLIKRTTSREPSASDCTEKVGFDRSCGNSSCRWHNHKNACSGSYTRMEKPPGYKDKKMGSKGEQELQDDKSSVLPSETRQTTRRSCKTEGMKGKSDGKKAITVANYFPSASGSKRNLGNNAYSGDEELNHEELKAVDLMTQSHAMVPELPKRVKTPASKRKNRYTRKKRRDGKFKKECTVVNEWLSLYGDEEEEEDVEPLINKRTERRKRQKLLKSMYGKFPVSEVMDDDAESRPCVLLEEDKNEEHEISVDVRNEQEPANLQAHAEDGSSVGATKPTDCSVPSQLACSQVALSPSNVLHGCKNVISQAGTCDGVAPPLNSPIGEDFVDISDS